MNCMYQVKYIDDSTASKKAYPKPDNARDGAKITHAYHAAESNRGQFDATSSTESRRYCKLRARKVLTTNTHQFSINNQIQRRT